MKAGVRKAHGEKESEDTVREGEVRRKFNEEEFLPCIDLQISNVTDRDWPHYGDRPHRAHDMDLVHKNRRQIS